MDKAALGYDYKGETEKHQSQKGELKLSNFCSSESVNQISDYFFSYSFFFFYQITQRALGGSLVLRRRK